MGSQQIWCEKEKSCYKAKSSKMKARRQQEELRWEWQASSSATRHTANESKALQESRAEGSRQVFRRAVASIWEHVGFYGSPPEMAVMALVGQGIPVTTVLPWGSEICSVNALFIAALPGHVCWVGRWHVGRWRSRWGTAQLRKAFIWGVTWQQVQLSRERRECST